MADALIADPLMADPHVGTLKSVRHGAMLLCSMSAPNRSYR
jgi:hypothetical protein